MSSTKKSNKMKDPNPNTNTKPVAEKKTRRPKKTKSQKHKRRLAMNHNKGILAWRKAVSLCNIFDRTTFKKIPVRGSQEHQALVEKQQEILEYWETSGKDEKQMRFLRSRGDKFHLFSAEYAIEKKLAEAASCLKASQSKKDEESVTERLTQDVRELNEELESVKEKFLYYLPVHGEESFSLLAK